MKKIILVLLMILVVPSVIGASISGNVYDLDLTKVDSAWVTINSVPVQKDVTENGAYRFEVVNGTYSIVAQQIIDGIVVSESSEEVVISDEGNFVLDFVLLPTLEAGLDDEIDVSLGEIPSADKSIVVLFVLIVAGYVIYLLLKTKKGSEIEEKFEDAIVHKIEHGIEEIETAEDAEAVLKFIKAQGGRVMQKDIRKNFPSSEAKISLIISELEEHGKVKRIKKGRGNLVVLK